MVEAQVVHFDFLNDRQQLTRVLSRCSQFADLDQTVSSAESKNAPKSRGADHTLRNRFLEDSSWVSLRASRISRCARDWLSTSRRRRRLTSMI